MKFTKAPKEKTELAVGQDLLSALPTDRAPWYRTKHLLQLNLLLLIPILSSAAGGFDSAIMNGLQTVDQWSEYFDHPKASILGVMNAVYPIGNLLGLPPATWLSDRYGRKVPIFIGIGLCIFGAALQAASQNLPMFIVARLLLGVSASVMALPSPILITELAYPIHRGKITSVYNTFYYFGSIFAAWSTYGTFRILSTWSWRIPSLLQGAIPLFQLAFLWRVPESPRWLVANGHAERARATLVKYHAGGDEASALVAYEMGEIEETLRTERHLASETSYMDLLNSAPNRKRTLIAALVGFFAQWNGVGVVSYYLTLVLDTIGITATSEQALINGLLQIFNWVAAIGAGALLVDRLGRRTLFITSAAGMLVSYIIWTALTSYFTRTLNQQAGHAVVAFIFVFYFFYGIAFTPLLVSYPVEIFPYALRGHGVTVALGHTYIGLIIGQFVNPVAMEKLGWRYYILFCCLNGILLVICWFMFPETRGRTLEQIAEVFDGKKETHEGLDGKLGDDAEKSAVEHVDRVDA